MAAVAAVFATAAVLAAISFSQNWSTVRDLSWPGADIQFRELAAAQTILDQRGLPNAEAVGGLPQAEQQALVGAIVRREIGVMALSALVVVFLALRAAGTAHGF